MGLTPMKTHCGKNSKNEANYIVHSLDELISVLHSEGVKAGRNVGDDKKPTLTAPFKVWFDCPDPVEWQQIFKTTPLNNGLMFEIETTSDLWSFRQGLIVAKTFMSGGII